MLQQGFRGLLRKIAVSGAMSGSRAENLLLFQLLLLQLAVGVQKTTETSAAGPRYMTFEAQNFLLNKDTYDYALSRLEDVAMGPRAVSHLKLWIPKVVF